MCTQQVCAPGEDRAPLRARSSRPFHHRRCFLRKGFPGIRDEIPMPCSVGSRFSGVAPGPPAPLRFRQPLCSRLRSPLQLAELWGWACLLPQEGREQGVGATGWGGG